VVGAIVIALATVPITGIQAWLDYPRILANMGPIGDVHDSVSPTIWLLPVIGYDAARLAVLSIGTAAIIYVAKSRPDIVSFPIAVTVSILVAPAVFHHYLSILVLPLLLAVAAGVRWWVVGLIYLLLWGGQQPALGDWAWVLSRVPQTVAYVLLIGALIATRRAPVSIPTPGARPMPAVA
jgi:hypothetical protein